MVQDSLTTQSLRRILQIGASIKDTCIVPQPAVQFDVSSIPTVNLEQAPSIQNKLLDLGLEPNLAEDLSLKYAQTCEGLALAAQRSLRQACCELASLPRHSALTPLPQLLSGVVDAYTARYTLSVRKLEERAIRVASSLKPIAKHPVTRKKSPQTAPFNHEFTPFLQKYFEYNAKPSAADRAAMAKKSGMEPRQIEVWFQNHRRRAKLEGKVLREHRVGDPAPFDLCLKSMEEKMEPYLVPDPLRQSVDSEGSEAGSDDEEDDEEFYNDKPGEVDLTDVLNPPPARHAFPMPWARSCKAPGAILKTQQFSFPPPEWPRKAAVEPVKRPEVTMDELSRAFGFLHVRDANRVLSLPFQIATTVIPSPAPHPALVRGKFTPAPVLATTTLNIVPAPRSRQRPFRSPSPFTQPMSLVPAGTPRRKKVAGPPRRTPKRMNNRGVSPATSESSTSRYMSETSMRSTSPPSRTPSLEASDFSPSRTPSFGSTGFSSRSSSASSGPATPVGSPLALSLDFSGPSSYGDLFGEQQQQHTSPVDARGSSPFPMGGKQPYQFAFASYAG
ncbi:hypothetical protein B0H11DRAFT_2290518 [Mycena galericulata]|nr:hypothetical protein B0H11DRAFT_2290518 [Mycena galericulata]